MLLDTASAVYAGSTPVSRVVSEGIDQYNRSYSADSLHGRHIFSTTWTDSSSVASPTGLAYSGSNPEATYDWTGIATAVTTTSMTRSPVTCCTLIGPAASTHYATVSDHARPAVGDTVYFVNSDGNEVSRTVSAIHLVPPGSVDTDGNPTGWVVLVEFSAPMVAAVDKCKIYSVATNTTSDAFIDKPLVCVELDRLLTVRTISSMGPKVGVLDGRSCFHITRYEGGVLEGGDSGKPAFIVQSGELIVVIGGTFAAVYTQPCGYWADDIDVVMADHSYVMQRTTIV